MADKLLVKWEEAHNATLDDLVHDIRIVWATKDAERTIYDTLLHTVHHASKLGEQVRRGEYQAVLDELGNTVMWFLTFVGKLQQSIEERQKERWEEHLFYTPLPLTDIVWNKYPYTCHACYLRLFKKGKQKEAWKRQCDCLLKPNIVELRTDKEKEVAEQALREFAEEHKDEEVTSLSGLEEMFAYLFESNYDNLSLESVAFHLLEEIGEISNALVRLYSYDLDKTPNPVESCLQRRRGLEGEIADTMSWIFAVSIKVKRLYEIYDKLPSRIGHGPFPPSPPLRAPLISFANILWNQYGDKNTGFLYCPVCGEPRCECKLRFYKDESGTETLIPKLRG